MYSSIYEYSKTHGLSLPKFRKKKKIEGYIKLSSDGSYEGFEKIPKDEIKRVWCPHIEGPDLCIICEKFNHIFLNDKATNDAKRKNKNYVDLTKEGANFSQTLKIIANFLNETENNSNFRNRVIEDIANSGIKEYISFRIDFKNAENKTDWEEWFAKFAETCRKTYDNTVISELSGQRVTPIIDKFPKTKSKIAGTGIPLYSNQHHTFSDSIKCSFVSYGWVNGIGCPMSQEEADTINAGLTHLLDSDTNNDRDFEFIYWYDKKSAEDLITRARMQKRRSKKSADDIEEDMEEEYTNVLDSVFKNIEIHALADQGKYHIVEYNLPEQGRISLSKEYVRTYKELYDSLQKWYADSKYVDKVCINENSVTVTYTLNNIYTVLSQCLQHLPKRERKDYYKKLEEEINNEYGQNKRSLLKAMLFTEKVPKIFLRNATEQLTRSYICDKQFENEKRNTRILLQIVKTCLIREGYKDMDAQLNKNAESIGYQCGRWFATIVRIQERSAAKNDKKLNSTLAGHYYKMAKNLPAKTFTIVNDLKEHYLSNLSVGERIKMECLFAEIAGKIGTSFPERFTIFEQGAFDLGYAQQRQAFFMSKNDFENKNSEDDFQDEKTE